MVKVGSTYQYHVAVALVTGGVMTHPFVYIYASVQVFAMNAAGTEAPTATVSKNVTLPGRHIVN